MKPITNYRELGRDPAISLLDHISDTPIPEKEKILAYLKSGTYDGVRCSLLYDYVKDVGTTESIFLYTDGEYIWTSEEIYHFEHYNLALNPEFIQMFTE